MVGADDWTPAEDAAALPPDPTDGRLQGLERLSGTFSVTQSQKTGTVSSLVVTSNELYPTARGAGSPVEAAPELGADTRSKTLRGDWWPFDSEADYALAHWMYESKLSSGAIDKYFKDTRLRPFHGASSFDSAATLKEKMHMIEENTTAGKWERLAIELPSSGIGFPPTKHYIIRRNVMDLIAFVVGHTLFTPNMIYVLVRQRNSDRGLIFSEMHTANWWWETQDQLPSNSTIILIILAIDKTHLLQTYGDQ